MPPKFTQLRRKTKLFLDKVIENPKMSAADAYIATHETNNKAAAAVHATRLLHKPSARVYLEKHSKLAKRKIVELVGSNREEIALKASIDIMDRTYGKAVQRSENSNVNVNVEASAEVRDRFTEFLKKQPIRLKEKLD